MPALTWGNLALAVVVAFFAVTIIAQVWEQMRIARALELKWSATEGYAGKRGDVSVSIYKGTPWGARWFQGTFDFGRGYSIFWIKAEIMISASPETRLLIVENVLFNTSDTTLVPITLPLSWGEHLKSFADSESTAHEILLRLSPSPIHPRRWKKLEITNGRLILYRPCGFELPSDREITDFVNEIRVMSGGKVD